jgi:hypothetical protein
MRVTSMRRLVAPLVLALLLGISAAGCGSGDATAPAKPKNPFAGYPKGPTRQFIIPGADNAVQEFGHEGSVAERRDVSALVEAWLRARVRGEWGRACAYMEKHLNSYAVVTGSEVSGKHLTSCARGLAALTHKAEKPRYNIRGGVASFRVKGPQGYAQYHGTDGEDWILSVQRQAGRWRVANLYPLERTR